MTDLPKHLDANYWAERKENEQVDEFPFEAWDLIAQRPVTVRGWSTGYPGHYHIQPGAIAHPSEIATVFPAWYVRAKQQMADAVDERETMADALDVGVQ